MNRYISRIILLKIGLRVNLVKGIKCYSIIERFTCNVLFLAFPSSKNSQADVWYEKTWTDYGLGETEANFGKTITLKPFQLKTDSQTDRYHS